MQLTSKTACFVPCAVKVDRCLVHLDSSLLMQRIADMVKTLGVCFSHNLYQQLLVSTCSHLLTETSCLVQVLHLPPQEDWPSREPASNDGGEPVSVERHSVMGRAGTLRGSTGQKRSHAQAAGLRRGASARSLDMPAHSR